MTPAISVLVSTRNRPESVAVCVRRVLASNHPAFEVVVVDQSGPEAAADARRRVGPDPRLRWIETDTRGLSASRNVGLTATRAPVIAFTDDDCEVEPGWVASVHDTFATDPELGLLFGAVELPPEDRAVGYAAEFDPPARVAYHGAVPPVDVPWGVGANMAARREVFDRVGRFDELLGAGAPLLAGEDTDLTIRAIAAGLTVVYTPDVRVVHRGVRRGSEAASLLRGYGIGIGATFAKHRRLGTPGGRHLLLGAVRHHGGRSVRNLLHGDRHPGFGLTAAILRGAVRAHRFGLDAEHCVLVDRGDRS